MKDNEKIRVALINYRTELVNNKPTLVSHWLIGEERISAATELVPELSDEEILEVVKLEIKATLDKL